MRSLIIGAILVSSQILADQFPKEIVIVGDSLSDSGNSRPALSFPGPPIFERTSPITSGTTWPVFLADRLGAKTLNPSTQKGTNFAYVGALTKGTFSFFPNPSLTEQVNSIVTDTSSPLFVFGGANDIFFDPTTIMNPGEDAARNVISILKKGSKKGFDTLVTFSLPDLSLMPSAKANAAQYGLESRNFNSTLVDELKILSFPVFQVDTFALFNEVVFNPQKFGFVNSTDAPEFPVGISGGANTAGFVFFYDGTHPTQAIHEIFSEYTFALLNGANFLSTMVQKPATFIRQYTANLKSQLYPIQPECECDCNTIRLFVSGNYSPVENPAINHCYDDRCQDGGNVAFGLTGEICDCITLGIAGGYGFDSSEFVEIDNTLNFDLCGWTVSAIGSYHQDHGYLSGIFTTAFLDFDNIKKQFFLGPAKFTTKADTDGIDYSGHLFGAFHFIACDCNVKTGPLFDLNYQYLCVDGYKEKGSSLGNLEFKDLSRHYFTAGFGWEARLEQHFSCFDLTYDFYLMGNKQFFEDCDTVRFRELSVSGSYGSWPIQNPKNGYLSGGAHFSSCFCWNITATLGYDFNVGADHMSEHFITFGLSFPIW